jgi:hypothetical protein
MAEEVDALIRKTVPRPIRGPGEPDADGGVGGNFGSGRMESPAWSRLAMAAVWWMAALPAIATTYYVSPTGNDTNAGTLPTAPLQSINTAIGKAGAGDTIHLIAGSVFVENVYFAPGSGGTSGSPKTLTTPTSDPATVKPTGNDKTACYIYNAGYITVSNIVFLGPGMDTHQQDGVMAYADDGAYHGLSFLNLDVSGFGATGIVLGGWGGTTYGFRDVLIEDCASHDNRKGGIASWAQYASANQDITVRGCTAFNNLGDPAASSHTGSGIVLGNVTGGLIEHCLAYNNGERCVTTGGPIGIWAWDASNVTIQFCEAYQNHAVNCDGGGFDLDGGCQDCVIQYCYSHDNDGAGYLICQYSGARAFTGNTVRYCISENDGRRNGFAGFSFWSSGSSGGIQDTAIYGNTVYNACSHVVRFHNTAGQSGTRLWNNVFISADSRKLLDGSPATGVARFQGNGWHSITGVYDIAGYASLAAWRSATGQEELSGSPVGMQADPRVLNPGGGGTIGDTTQLATLSAYRLHADSPCLEAGLDLNALFGVNPGPCDYYGNALPQGAALDIGAHECPQAVIAVPLVAGYNLIALPLEPETELDSETLAQRINAQGGSCTSVIRYTGGEYRTHPVGSSQEIFPIEVGKGYFVRCTGSSTLDLNGYRFSTAGADLALAAGYNLLGMPLDPTPGKYTSESAAVEINGQGGSATQVLRYAEGQFHTHPVGSSQEIFELVPGTGYFIRCAAGSTWTVTK